MADSHFVIITATSAFNNAALGIQFDDGPVHRDGYGFFRLSMPRLQVTGGADSIRIAFCNKYDIVGEDGPYLAGNGLIDGAAVLEAKKLRLDKGNTYE